MIYWLYNYTNLAKTKLELVEKCWNKKCLLSVNFYRVKSILLFSEYFQYPTLMHAKQMSLIKFIGCKIYFYKISPVSNQFIRYKI